MRRDRIAILMVLLSMWSLPSGCRSPRKHRIEADKVAYNTIEEQQREALGYAEEFSIERPSDILRRRLLVQQELPRSGDASLGTDRLKLIEHWPEKKYPKPVSFSDPNTGLEAGKSIQLSLIQALQVGARNSFEYQSYKEDVFRAALDLDLERNEFRSIFAGEVESLAGTDGSGDRTVSGTESSGSVDSSRKLKSGTQLSTGLAVDLANLLTMGGASSLGIMADATITIPLLRGSGEHVVAEPLTQAQRDVVYAIYKFERFKQTFAVNVAGEYLGVLRQRDQVENTEDNYESLIRSARRSRRLADAGMLPEIQVDQAVQDELRARNRWISATESYKSRLDSFKDLLGLPPDAAIELDRSDLETLVAPASELVVESAKEEGLSKSKQTSPADAPIELVPANYENAGPLELKQDRAIQLALENRLDLRMAQGKVYDAQRAVVVLADALGAELTLFGSADLGEGRSVSSATSDDAKLRMNKGTYSGLLTLDLPLERTAERNAYRNGYITLERTVRELQKLEDQIKLSIRNKLRDMLEAREGLQIQGQSVIVAEKRVKSTNMFIEAGRAQIRDLLEAQDALLSAKNGLTSAAINYRVAELELQRDMGVLKVDKSGLWQEYLPKGISHAQD